MRHQHHRRGLECLRERHRAVYLTSVTDEALPRGADHRDHGSRRHGRWPRRRPRTALVTAVKSRLLGAAAAPARSRLAATSGSLPEAPGTSKPTR